MERDGDDDMFNISQWSLRFKKPEVETGFNEGRKPRLLVNTSRAALLSSLAIAWTVYYQAAALVSGQAKFNFDDPKKFRDEDIALIQKDMYMWCALLALSLTCVVLPRAACVQQGVASIFCEVSVIVCLCILVLALFLQEVSVYKGAMGQSGATEDYCSFHTWRAYRLTLHALSLDAVITVAHLTLPIRWTCMLALQVWTAMILIMFPFVMPMELTPFVFVIMMVLVIGSSIGLRSNELQDRRLYKDLVGEKSLRAQAEFRAEKTLTTRGEARQGGLSAEQASKSSISHREARSSATSDLFNEAFRTGLELPATRASLEDLGRSEQWLISERDLHIRSSAVLGRGTFGVVVKGSYCCTPVAVKLFTDQSAFFTENEDWVNTTAFREIRVLRHVRHPNIASFHGACISKTGDIRLVMERIKGLPLRQFVMTLQDCKWFKVPPYDSQSCVGKGICSALVYLHARQPVIVHGDLNPSNVLVEILRSEPCPRLVDFGTARRVKGRATLLVGTEHFAAPEVVANQDVSPKPSADIYSLGLVLYAVASCKRFRVKKGTARSRELDVAGPGSEGQGRFLRWDPLHLLMESWRACIEACTLEDPERRPLAKDVFKDLFELETPEQSERDNESNASMSLGSQDLDSLKSASSRTAPGPPRGREGPQLSL